MILQRNADRGPNPKLKLKKKKPSSFKKASKPCKHPMVIHRRCCCCNKFLPPNHGVSFDYLSDGLRISHEEIIRLKSVHSEKVFGQKKLHLVLDLDHTLIHAKEIEKLTDNEWSLSESNIWNGDFFVFNDEYLVKLMPFFKRFLEEASSMFELTVCSMGTGHYVQSIVQFLDPEGNYFGNRVIAREDFGQRYEKTLDLVLGLERGTVIVDGTKSVWHRFLDKLIWIERYVYFKVDWADECYIEIQSDESELDGSLAEDLKSLHSWFFHTIDHINDKDVKILSF